MLKFGKEGRRIVGIAVSSFHFELGTSMEYDSASIVSPTSNNKKLILLSQRQGLIIHNFNKIMLISEMTALKL